MLGWKAVERIIEPSIGFEEAKRLLQEEGFRLNVSNPSHAIFKSEGTQNPWTTLAPNGENVPIELALAESHSGLHVQLRYGTFILFDTGDLKTFADEIARLLSPSPSEN